MSQLSKLTYLPLDNAASSIRLLTLFPSPSSEATIECSLENASTTPITVNGSQKAVTTNLAAALRHLRALGCVDKPWWIDAICIDQDEVTEKGHQVRFMGDIYQKADEVIAWLGFEERNDKLEEITSKIGTANTTQKNPTYNDAAIYSILQSNWWTRRWIVQEAALAKELTLLWRLDLIPWMRFWSAWTNYQLKNGNLLCKLDVPLIELCWILDGASSIRREELTLLRPLSECRGSYKATVKADYVYALLGIAIDADWIIPDYGKALDDVAKDIVVASLADETFTASPFEVLRHCGSSNQDGGECQYVVGCKDCAPGRLHLPTWVPFWDHSMNVTQMRNCNELALDFFREMHGASKPLLDEDRKLLTVKGVLLDEIWKELEAPPYREEYYNPKRYYSGTSLVLRCICHESSRKGDIILWVPYRQAFILQKHGDGWIIIGNCAVNSVRGSADELRRVLRALPLQDFRIY